MNATMLMWVFAVVILTLLAIDLGVLNRRAHTASMLESVAWCLTWFLLAVGFAVLVFLTRGAKIGMEFVAGYVIEVSLSVDNVFLFAVLFSFFRVPGRYQHTVLFWGILSAMVMRGVMILAGSALIVRFHWIMYVFGVFLVLTGIKMLLNRGKEPDVADSALVRWLQAHLRVTPGYHGNHFLVRLDAKLYATPLLMVLVLIEITDLMFAVDSIPAVFAVSQNPLVVFTSNIFAILGLRSVYFLLAGVMRAFRYLSVGLSFVLAFVGVKMLGLFHVAIAPSLGVIIAILSLAIGASLVQDRLDRRRAAADIEEASLPDQMERSGRG